MRRTTATLRVRGSCRRKVYGPADGGTPTTVCLIDVDKANAARRRRAARRGEAVDELEEHRRPDGDDLIPHPQAFSIPVIRAYPKRTKACRTCDELNTGSGCARACCRRLSRSHATLVNAIADGACPLDRFPQEP